MVEPGVGDAAVSDEGPSTPSPDPAAAARPWGGVAFGLVALGVIAGLVLVAQQNRFVNDDAFIIFRYARNLAEGLGLVWNPGQRVEGYTSPLWTLILAAALRAGLDPVATAQNLGLGLFALACAAVLFSARRSSRSSLLGLLITGVYGLNYSVSCYATGGLATSLHLCLAALIHAQLVALLDPPPGAAAPAPSFGRALLLSTSCGLAFVTRMEAALWIGPAMLVLLLCSWRRSASGAAWVAAVVPAGLLAATLLAHRQSYYGEWLPNTFYAKSGAGMDASIGAAYVKAFLANYRLDLLALLVLPLLLLRVVRGGGGLRALVAVGCFVLASWTAYLISVNGDYMEFRFMLPVVAPLLLLVALALRDLRRLKVPAAAVLILVAAQAGWVQWRMQEEVRVTLDPQSAEGGMKPADFGYELPEGVVPISNLRKNLYGRKPNWVGVGEALAEVFEADPSVRIAVSAAGAIPYYSRLPTLDLMGLNDAWVARNGVVQGQRAGHTRYAPPEYVMQHADLSLGHPVVVNRRQLQPTMSTMSPQRFWVPRALLEEGARYLVLPLDRRTVVVMLQLRAHPAIDAAVQRHSLQTFALPRRG